MFSTKSHLGAISIIFIAVYCFAIIPFILVGMAIKTAIHGTALGYGLMSGIIEWGIDKSASTIQNANNWMKKHLDL